MSLMQPHRNGRSETGVDCPLEVFQQDQEVASNAYLWAASDDGVA